MVAQHIFVLIGVDNQLSIAEVISVMQSNGVEVEFIERVGRIALFTAFRAGTRISILPGLERLGWSFKIGRLSDSIPSGEHSIEDYQDATKNIEFPEPLAEKSRWGISVFSPSKSVDPSIFSRMKGLVASHLKENGVKKTKFVPTDVVSESFREVSCASIIRNNLLRRGFEVLIIDIGDKLHFGLTEWAVDTVAFKARDLSRPRQRFEYSIPPRLARAMINLTGVKKGDVVLDPFCGFGTILQEALLLGLKPIGVDIDDKCVSATQKNLSWIKKTAGITLPGEHVMIGDATHLGSLIPKQSVDAIVTEPILVPRLLRSPSAKKARSILKKTENLYIAAIQEMAKTVKVTGKMALIAPFIVPSDGNRVSLDLERAFNDAGLRKFKLQGIPLTSPIAVITKREFRVSRELHFLEKA